MIIGGVDMEIILSEKAGFCFGVERAVNLAYSKAGNNGVYTYGPIIHNKEVISDLEKIGVRVTDNFDCCDNGGEIIIRSHGVPKSVYEELERRNIKYTDCTCPFVKKIHNIVSKSYYDCKKNIIIIGNPIHPEVVGINGWCDNTAVILSTVEDAEKFVPDSKAEYVLVVQTTFQIDVYKAILDRIEKKCTDIDVHYTICSSTNDRQKEALEIAEKVDAMIVLGDKNSSNSQKLYEISKKKCKNVFFCEKILDLELKNILKYGKIGVTAGASTPPALIKEAIKFMSDVENKSFEEMINESLVTLHTGEIVKGTVISISDMGEVSVNLGYKSDGLISKAEFSDDPNVNPADVVKAGDEIEVFVVRVNDGDGNVLLSKKRVDADKSYVVIEEAFNNNTTVRGKVIDVVKGGLIASVDGIKVFVPSSQISNRYVDDLASFKGNEYDFNVLEYDRAKKRIVVGRKALAQKEIDEKRAEVFASIQVGSKITGTVSRIVEFGAFVDLGGVDGLIHISEMSWGRVKKVSDVVKVGDTVTVTVLDVNQEKGKISLSLKDPDADPWKDAEIKYAKGSIVTGKVVRMVSFGAFVELEEGIDGLVHISQIAYNRVEKPEDVLSIGQEIQAKVTELNLENKKISLSIKETLEKPSKPDKEEETAEE